MSLETRLKLLADPAKTPELANITRGIEKESLRVTPSGHLAQTPHPEPLGSALTHSSITTDYSEALLEFITAPSASIEKVLEELEEIHHYTYQHMDDELLWVNSMPCQLGQDSDIPVAKYGSSNIGRMKTTYRIGLGHRYGRLMQTIAGIHYNFSVPDSLWEWLKALDKSELSLQDYKTQGYFSLIRNFRRYFWLLLYLLGAAPAVCNSFLKGRQHKLVPVNSDNHSMYTPYATSLRMGDLGYQSDAQSSLIVCYNNIENYVDTLQQALLFPYPQYQNIGLKGDKGEYRQLSTHLLQIENEFYSPIRPKRTTHSRETPIHALCERGIEYIEVRCIDLNPLLACGIDAETIRFLDTFLLFCLLKDSPQTDNREYKQILENQRRTVYNGRDPELRLQHGEHEILLRKWGEALLAQMQPVADLLNQANQTDDYSRALNTMQARLADDSLTPSAQLLEEMHSHNETYFRMAMRLARKHRDYFQQRPVAENSFQKYRVLAEQSRQKQQQLEAADQGSFEEFLEDYYRQYQSTTALT